MPQEQSTFQSRRDGTTPEPKPITPNSSFAERKAAREKAEAAARKAAEKASGR